MLELIRPAVTTTVRAGLFLSLCAWSLTQSWIIEWTGVCCGRPLAVTVYDQGLLISDVGVESLESRWTILRRPADFDARAPGPGDTMVQAISPIPGTAFLWCGDTVLGYRHQFALLALSGTALLLAFSSRSSQRFCRLRTHPPLATPAAPTYRVRDQS